MAAWPGVLGVVDGFSWSGRHSIGGDAEFPVQRLVVGRRAAVLDADAAPGIADDLLPAAGDPGFHADRAPMLDGSTASRGGPGAARPNNSARSPDSASRRAQTAEA